VLFGVPFLLYQLQLARRKKQRIRFKSRRIGVYLVCALTGIVILTSHGYTVIESGLFSIAVGIVASFFVRPPQRTRRIPTKVRRYVISRDLKGERFNPKLHDVDHIVPYSRGGDHSPENLRVVLRSINRSRGAKMPGFRDLF
jgi:hypothetical protein